MILLFVVTAVVAITHVAPLAVGSQENAPAAAEPHATNDGLAALPLAAQFVALANNAAELIPGMTASPVEFRVGVAGEQAPGVIPLS
jgi:hypothetical protein